MATVRNSIKWGMLNDTVEHYQQYSSTSSLRHFVFIDVPWLVSEKAIRSTFNGKIHEAFPGQYAVGSAEQSFAQLLLDGSLNPKGRYVAISPCFRDEPVLDDLHQNHFMKVELFQAFEGDPVEAYILACDAASWFEKLSKRFYGDHKIEVVQTPDGYDVEANGIEVGSYGIRHWEGFSWVYGTALAEPRFSTVMLRR